MTLKRFEKGNKGAGGNGYDARFSGQIVAIVQRNEVTFTTSLLNALGSPKFVGVYTDSIEWALKAESNRADGYTVANRTKGLTSKYLACGKFVRDEKIPVGYYYIGRIENGMVIFSKTPSGQV